MCALFLLCDGFVCGLFLRACRFSLDWLDLLYLDFLDF